MKIPVYRDKLKYYLHGKGSLGPDIRYLDGPKIWPLPTEAKSLSDDSRGSKIAIVMMMMLVSKSRMMMMTLIKKQNEDTVETEDVDYEYYGLCDEG